jgi:transposase
LTSANTNDGTQLLPLVDAILPVKGKPGAPRRRPAAICGDRAYYSHVRRMLLYLRGIKPFLAKPREPHGSGLGTCRWVIERPPSWLHQSRRLRVRYERRADIREGFLSLGCASICWKRLTHRFCQALLGNRHSCRTPCAELRHARRDQTQLRGRPAGSH